MDMTQVSEETLAQLAKAATDGIYTSTGIQGYDLSGLVAQVPVNVPARNNTSAFPRTIAGVGNRQAVWRAILNINNQQTDAAVGFDKSGSFAKIEEKDISAPFRPMAKAGRVTLDAVAIARNFADALAVDTLQTLNQVFLMQDIHLINSQAWGLGKPEEPSLTAATTGGSLKKEVKLEVKVAARSGANYFLASENDSEELVAKASEASTAGKATTGDAETCSITASIKAVKGAVAYDWYVGEEGSKLWYYTTTTVAKVTFTTLPTEAKEVPSLPLISQGKPSAEPPTKEESYSENWYNGVLASTIGDFGSVEQGPVTPGTGTPSGSVWEDWGGNAIEGEGASVPALDQMFQRIWDNVQLSPTAIMGNSEQIEEISLRILGNDTATTFLPPTDADARTNLAGGGYVGRYINKAAGGVPVMFEVHPHMAPGTLMFRTDRVPYPASNIGTVYEVECQYDTMQFDYAAAINPGVIGGGPRYDYEVRSMETLKNYAPAAQGVLTNVAKAA